MGVYPLLMIPQWGKLHRLLNDGHIALLKLLRHTGLHVVAQHNMPKGLEAWSLGRKRAKGHGGRAKK